MGSVDVSYYEMRNSNLSIILSYSSYIYSQLCFIKKNNFGLLVSLTTGSFYTIQNNLLFIPFEAK